MISPWVHVKIKYTDGSILSGSYRDDELTPKFIANPSDEEVTLQIVERMNAANQDIAAATVSVTHQLLLNEMDEIEEVMG